MRLQRKAWSSYQTRFSNIHPLRTSRLSFAKSSFHFKKERLVLNKILLRSKEIQLIANNLWLGWLLLEIFSLHSLIWILVLVIIRLQMQEFRPYPKGLSLWSLFKLFILILVGVKMWLPMKEWKACQGQLRTTLHSNRSSCILMREIIRLQTKGYSTSQRRFQIAKILIVWLWRSVVDQMIFHRKWKENFNNLEIV